MPAERPSHHVASHYQPDLSLLLPELPGGGADGCTLAPGSLQGPTFPDRMTVPPQPSLPEFALPVPYPLTFPLFAFGLIAGQAHRRVWWLMRKTGQENKTTVESLTPPGNRRMGIA